MPQINPTPEQFKRAKNDLYYRQVPYIKALNHYMSLKRVRLIIDEKGAHFDYGEETEKEKEIKKIIEQIRLSVEHDLYHGKY